MQNENHIRRSILLGLYPRLDARTKAGFELLQRRLQVENSATRIHRRKCFAARYGALLGGLFLLAAILNFLLAMPNWPQRLVFVAGLAWGGWGYHFLRTHHH